MPKGNASSQLINVLILVVMEEGQRLSFWGVSSYNKSLNPCCNGRGPKTTEQDVVEITVPKVLILVVMEEGQRLDAPIKAMVRDENES